MSKFFGYLSLGLGLALPPSACRAGVGGSVAVAEPAIKQCFVEAGSRPFRDTIAVALQGPLHAGAAGLPQSPAERFIAAHLNGDSFLADCTGRAAASWPSSFRLASGDPPTLVPTRSGLSIPTIIVWVAAPASDPRDLIDRGADVVITSDAATLEYARSRGELRFIPLASTTTYALVSPPGSRLPIEPTAALRIELARDALRSEAIPAEPPGWWNGNTPCLSGRQQASTPLNAIAYPEQDVTARALAERLVALAAAGGPQRIIGYAPAAFDSALAGGRAAGYILSLPRSNSPDCSGFPPMAPGSHVAFLVDLRATAVLRPGVPPFSVGGDGLIHFMGTPAP